MQSLADFLLVFVEQFTLQIQYLQCVNLRKLLCKPNDPMATEDKNTSDASNQ